RHPHHRRRPPRVWAVTLVLPTQRAAEWAIPELLPRAAGWWMGAHSEPEGDGMAEAPIRLRPVVEDDLEMFRRFLTEPWLVGLDWAGYRDAGQPDRRYAVDGYLGEAD